MAKYIQGDYFELHGKPVRVVQNNIIELNRGDSFEIPIFINVGERFEPVRYILRPEDKVYVGIMEPNHPFECSLIKKVLTRSDFNKKRDVVFKLDPIDTEYVMPGKYYLEAKIVLGNGKVYTILPKRQFWVVE